MAGEIARFFVSIGANVSGAVKGISTTEREMQGLGRATTQLIPQVGALEQAIGLGLAGGALFGASQIGRMAFEMGEAGAQSLRMRTAFEDMWSSVGMSGDMALKQLRTASSGTISDMNLMLAANRANMLGVTDDVGELAQLMEIARFRGRAMGLDMTQAFDNIVTGIGRASPLILDNLGIVIDSKAAYDEYARSIGKTADALTEAEKKQVILNKVLEDTPDVAPPDDAKDKYDQVAASVDNLSTSFSIGLSNAIEGFIGSMAGATSALEGIFGGSVMEAGIELAIRVAIFGENPVKVFEEIRDRAREAEREIQRTNEQAYEMSKMEGFARNAAMGIDAITAAAQAADAALSGLAGAGQMALDVVGKELSSNYRAAVGDIASAVAEGLLSEAEAKSLAQNYMNGLKSTLQQASAEGVTDVTLIDFEIQAAKDEKHLRDYLDSLDKTIAQSPEARSIQSHLESLVGQAIAPTFSGDPTGVLDSLGLHIDTADEEARRLASVMAEGLQSEWTQHFVNSGILRPEDLADDDTVKGAAAKVLRDFQAGLRPDLIDKETAKENVRRMIIGDQNTNALIQEIINDLAGEGLNVSMSQVRVAMGDPTAGIGEGVGQSVRDEIVSALENAQVVNPFVQSLQDDIDTNSDALKDRGRAMGRYVAEGFGEDFINSVDLVSLIEEIVARLLEEAGV